jgi:nicotinate-nucleotide adenylyltransferase
MKVALYGGSFNPPHVGHVLAAAYLTSIGAFERVIVVPVFEHAFDKTLLGFVERVALCREAFECLKGVEVSTIEGELPRPSYTLTTVRALLERHPDYEISLAVGADVIPEIPRWHGSEELRRLTPIYVMPRRGYDNSTIGRAILPEVSSSELRSRLADPVQRLDPELTRLLPHAVLSRILERGYYA